MAAMSKQWVVVALVGGLAAGGCSWWQNRGTNTWSMTSTLPAVSGEVVTQRWEGKDRVVEVQVQDLAPANRVVPDATTYVVWFQPAGKAAPPQNMGVLQPNEERSASFKTKTDLVSFDVFVTPETMPTPSQPSPEKVLVAHVRGPTPS